MRETVRRMRTGTLPCGVASWPVMSTTKRTGWLVVMSYSSRPATRAASAPEGPPILPALRYRSVLY